MSSKLRLLSQAGLLGRDPRSGCVYYEIIDPIIFELCELVSQRLKQRLGEQQNQWD